MSLFGDIGKTLGGIVGGAVGTALLPGIGTAIGSQLGSVLGQGLGDTAFDQFKKDPIGTLTDPASIPARFADETLAKLGCPKEFRSLVHTAIDPQSAIKDFLKGHNPADLFRPINTGGCTSPAANHGDGLSTNGNVVDTGRYLISFEDDKAKIYDKQTNTWVQADGDPHLRTSDGDHGQFHDNLTIDLPDGTKVTLKTTPKNADGIAYLDSAAVIKGDEAVVVTGLHDGKPGVHVGNVLNNADSVDRQFADGTVLRAGKQVDDLTYANGGGEIVGSDKNARWGEWNLDGHGGVSRNSPRGGDPVPSNPAPAKPSKPSVGGDDDISGDSIQEILFKLLNKAQRKLADKVNELKNLQAPDGGDTKATADFDSKKQTLLIEIQQAQQEVKQFADACSNVSKTDADIKSGIIQKFNVQ